ncbi:MAG TPA: NAD(P)-dependent oxidoreductase [Candidatus Cloacimonas sp.]|nr:NAD(P)-dependent oxidoreductase [Candidatus Cloacimonas sp.]MDD3733292.1 NAD(P)-dependent oxidoreductase [Candidatus Cloacimonadota bacterium]HNZ33017.1 NAD(P)-dependent oxidoreductase [Candidatus Cloacimonas sp.]HPH71072.1 NAD(P)-dependent oxidoreductase [Candidatus Cloacimonas sp.]HPZ01795.1 NAD(P)-dependent oxidoreductase [Candidatus Cloacimonas sp.]
MDRLLITGITGFIGRNVLRELMNTCPDYSITALVRPQTHPNRYSEFGKDLRIIEIDLADTASLKEFLFTNEFDTILHIGALRGGRKFPKETYLRSNVYSTGQMVEYCLAKEARLIYCSSVGVFGAIPQELPAGPETEKNPDNYYHYTKIESERIINRAILNGLKASIIRPSIAYGEGDFGFPYQLVKLVDKYMFPLINRPIWIHLCHIDALVKAFVYLATNEWKSGLTLTIADREPVRLQALVDFISRQLHNKNYPGVLTFDRIFFAWGEKLARMLKNELWISRFELISKSWFYDVTAYYDIMEREGIKPHFTIPEFEITIKDYQKH